MFFFMNWNLTSSSDWRVSGLIPNAHSLYVEVCAPDGKLALPSVYECVCERENVDL